MAAHAGDGPDVGAAPALVNRILAAR